MDRTIAPKTAKQFSLSPVDVESSFINNCGVYFVKGGGLPLIKLEFVFKAGTRFQKSPLIAALANDLLKEGTKSKSSSVIAETFDQLGAYVQFDYGKDFSNVVVFCLKKNLDPVLGLLRELFIESIFPEKEFKQIVSTKKSQFQVNLDKVGFIASQTYNQLFYKGHPYSMVASLEDFDTLKLTDVVEFANDYVINKSFDLYVSGDIDDIVKKSLEDYVGSFNSLMKIDFDHKNLKRNVFNEEVELKDKLQANVRLGSLVIGKSHPDIHKLSIFNTLLGGYFGSRLMQNIREDKGWTYGISSTIMFNQDCANWICASEVNGDKANATKDEILKEIKRLKTELVSESELDRVRSYMNGKLLKSFDGPFEQTDRFFSVNTFGLNWSFYQNYLDVLNTITPVDIIETGEKYFNLDDISSVIVKPK